MSLLRRISPQISSCTTRYRRKEVLAFCQEASYRAGWIVNPFAGFGLAVAFRYTKYSVECWELLIVGFLCYVFAFALSVAAAFSMQILGWILKGRLAELKTNSLRLLLHLTAFSYFIFLIDLAGELEGLLAGKTPLHLLPLLPLSLTLFLGTEVWISNFRELVKMAPSPAPNSPQTSNNFTF